MVSLGIALLSAGWILDGTARTEVRAGSSVAGENPNSATVSADLRAHTVGPDGEFSIGVAPSGVLAQGNQLYTRAFAEAATGRGLVQARLRQRLGYGTLDLSPLSGQPQASGAVQPPPAARFVSVSDSSTTLELSAQATRGLLLSGSAGLVVSSSGRRRAWTRWVSTRLGLRWATRTASTYASPA
jgi:hypothetical protein